MNVKRPFKLVLPLLAVALVFSTVAPAQQQPAQKPAPAKPAAAAPAKPAAAAPAKPAAPASPTAQATLLGQFGDWGAYTATPGGRKICFALSKPTSSVDNPPNRRKPNMTVYMFVSSRPSEKVKDEVSMLVTGYQLKPNTDASALGGERQFPHVHPERWRVGEEHRRRIQAARRDAQAAPKWWSKRRPLPARRPPTRSR